MADLQCGLVGRGNIFSMYYGVYFRFADECLANNDKCMPRMKPTSLLLFGLHRPCITVTCPRLSLYLYKMVYATPKKKNYESTLKGKFICKLKACLDDRGGLPSSLTVTSQLIPRVKVPDVFSLV